MNNPNAIIIVEDLDIKYLQIGSNFDIENYFVYVALGIICGMPCATCFMYI